ncbi:MAG TPA: hypothetical protein VGM28_09105, partial [Candidatus Limnocylindrales bacterium]
MAVTLPAPRTPAPLSPDDIARIRAPFRGARLLPGTAYHDEGIFAWEREEIFYRDWLAVARAEELAVTETLVLQDALRKSLEAELDAVIVNGLAPDRFTPADARRLA